MSIKAMIHIFDLPEGSLTSSQKFVAVSYADHADSEGRNIFPAVATIAKKTALTPRTVQRCTRQLVEKGLFIPDGKHPEYGTNQWRIDLEWGGDTVSGVTSATQEEEKAGEGVTPDAEKVPPMSPEPPSLTTKNQKSKDEPPPPPGKPTPGKRAAPKSPKPPSKKKLAELAFIRLSGIPAPPLNTAGQRKAAGSLWWQPINRMLEMADGNFDAILQEAISKMRSDRLTIATPKSVLAVFTSLYSENLGSGNGKWKQQTPEELAENNRRFETAETGAIYDE